MMKQIKATAMNKTLSISLLALLPPLLFNPAIAGERVDRTLSADNVSRLNIDNRRGEVKIVAWDKDEIKVTGELDDKVKKLIFEQSGSVVNLKVKVPNQGNWYGDKNTGSDLTVYAPASVRIDANGVSSDFEVEGFTEAVEIRSVSGTITAENLASDVELNTVSGDVRSTNLTGKIDLNTVSGVIRDSGSNGRLRVKAVSGDIDIESRATEVSAEAVSGDIELRLSQVEDLSITTVSGDIDSQLALLDNGQIRYSSVSGDFDLVFTDKVSASFSFHASAGGDLVNKLTSDKAEKAKYGPQSKLRFTTGNGSASVKGNTVSGRIRVSEQ